MVRMLSAALALVLVCGCGATGAAAETARGRVYEDLNRNGVRDEGEPGIAGVGVSNGRLVVQTAKDGTYALPVTNDTIIFVIKPRGWQPPVDELNIPRFYYIHKPEGSPVHLKYEGVAPTGPLPATIDFPLYRQAEPDRFDVLLVGDTQPYTMQEVHYLAHDIVAPLIGVDAAFALSLGDLVGDDLSLFGPMSRTMAHLGIPLRYVRGNHDSDYEAHNDEQSDDVFERHFGPPYYSFDYGPVHFIVLDDIVWHGRTEERKGYYEAGLGAAQLEFLRNDLALVPPERLVVLAMHIPIVEIAERAELYQLLAARPHTKSFSAHTHVHRHWFLDAAADWPGATPHHHTTLTTACGSWWRGAPDELGLPHTTMRDGTPNGCCIATFDGHTCTVRYRAARRPADYQMNIHAPDAVTVAELGAAEVLVNVFAGSERSTVEMRVASGPWTRLELVAREDPYYAAIKEAEQSDAPPRGRPLPKAAVCSHLWAGRLPTDLPPGTHLIEVRTTDVYGQTYVGRRLIAVQPAG